MSGILLMVADGRGFCKDYADQVFDRIVENWRWSYFWFGKTGIDDVYIGGKSSSALIFWTKNSDRPVRGLCSVELSVCVAYSGVYLDPAGRTVRVDPHFTSHQALNSWIDSGFRDSLHLLPIANLGIDDFEVNEKLVSFPELKPPSAILRRVIPRDALRDVPRIKSLLLCSSALARPRHPGCTGQLILPYYGSLDPYWFVLRTCSPECEFKGDAIEELARSDRGWEASSSGYVSGPKVEVERLKQRIEKAGMLRVVLH